MIKDIKEKQMIEQEVIISKICTCDICKKTIYHKKFDEHETISARVIGSKSVQWYTVTTGHRDWGNDSVDSIETIYVCSPECLKSAVEDYCNRSFQITGPGIHNTEWMEIEHNYGATMEVSNET